MKTDDLIARLAMDPVPRDATPARALALAIAAGVLLIAVAFFALIGPRPDFAAALHTWRFDFKFVVTLVVAISSLSVLRLALYPEGRPNLLMLLPGPVLLVLAGLVELFALPPAVWVTTAVGDNALNCLTIVPAFGIIPLLLLVVVIRRGATTMPGRAGFAAGLAAGGLAASFYAANCTDDSPLFVATWYPLAILVLGLLGALIGRLAARW